MGTKGQGKIPFTGQKGQPGWPNSTCLETRKADQFSRKETPVRLVFTGKAGKEKQGKEERIG